MWKKTSPRIIVHLIWNWCCLFQMLRKGACLGQNLMEPGGSWKYCLTLAKRWMTTASPTHCLHLLMMTWTLKTPVPLTNCYRLKHVAGQSRLMSMACSPRPLQHTDPDFAFALQKCREENSILSIAVNVHNRRIDHALSANQAKHIPIYGGVDSFSMQPFFTMVLLQMQPPYMTHCVDTRKKH